MGVFKEFIAPDTFKRMAKKTDKAITEVKLGTATVKVRNTVSITEMLALTTSAVDTCFTSDGQYVPEMEDFAIKCGIIATYTNVQLPEELNEQYDVVYKTTLFDDIIGYINPVQYREIEYGVKARIENMIDADIMAIRNKYDKLADALSKFDEQITAMFSGIEPGMLQDFVQAIGSNGLDEEKLARAFLSHKEGSGKQEPPLYLVDE